MVQPLQIGFLTTLNVNVGDEFIREGVYHCLDRLNRPYSVLLVNKHDVTSLCEPRDIELETVRDKYADSDVFVQSGAPVFWHNRQSKSTTAGWHQWAWEDRILGSLNSSQPVFFNLGAGSCFPIGDRGVSFLADADCVDFARRSSLRAAVLTVRDEVASHLLNSLAISHHRLPCPAFLAGARWPRSSESDHIGVNVMPIGGHYDFSASFARYSWVKKTHKMVRLLRRLAKLVFICHSEDEREMARLLAAPGEAIFLSTSYRDYLALFPRLAAVFANRVHCAVTAAGFGVPAVIAGTDTRALIGTWIGLPVSSAAQLDVEQVVDHINCLLQHRSNERDRLINLRDETVVRYTELLAPILADLPARKHSEPVVVAIGADEPVLKWLDLHPEDKTWSSRLGMESFWFIPESGFHPKEPYEGQHLRWTGKEARLTLPSALSASVKEIRFDFWPVHPPGHSVRIRVAGREQTIQPESGPFSCHIEAREGKGTEGLVVELIASSVIQAPGDERELGVALRNVQVYTQSAIAERLCLLDARINPSGSLHQP